ncbi:MAG: Fe-S protein assembly co-chaperone HscB [Rhodocyclales bacterium]|nr:Fe-S protein assembly co-chaperone HscB [Rhodocyclales bacterium]
MSIQDDLPNIQFSDDHFALFELPRQQALDMGELDQRFRRLQSVVHPDRYVQAGETEKRLAMQWATRVNEAYQTLKPAGQRALYLLNLLGFDPQIESNTAMPTAFLVQQMELREEVMAARAAGDENALDAAHQAMRREVAEAQQELIVLIDQRHNFAAAADLVRKLMFQEKLLREINDALEAVTL